MAEPEVKPPAISEIDLKNMPKISPEDFKGKPPTQPLRYKIEIVMTTGNSILFEVVNGEEAAKFLDSYNALVERKTPIARWSIGNELYAIPMSNIIMLKLHKPAPQDMINAGTN